MIKDPIAEAPESSIASTEIAKQGAPATAPDAPGNATLETKPQLPAPSYPEHPRISIVIPLFNEEESIAALYDGLVAALANYGKPAEVIIVDDGSRDRSFALLSEIALKDARFTILRLRRNSGQTAAFSCGFDHARGDVVITMDADLQNDPMDIPLLMAKIDEGYDIVSGWRLNRQDRYLDRKLPSMIANRLISNVTDVKLHDYGCSLKAYRRDVLQHVHLYGELHRFIPALASQVGGTVTEVPVNHRVLCQFGSSKYGISRTVRVMLDLITVWFLGVYQTRPIHVFGLLGLISAGIGTLIGLYLTFIKIFEGVQIGGWPMLMLAVLLIVIGVQLITMGLLGEMITRTYYESQNKPIYILREQGWAEIRLDDFHDHSGMSADEAACRPPVLPPAERDGFWRVTGFSTLLLAIALVPGLLINMGRDLNPDEHQFITSGVLLARDGLLPYRDYAYFHVPNLTLVYAALFHFTDSYLLTARLFSIACSFLLLLTILLFTVSRWRGEPWSVRMGMGAVAVLLLAFAPIFAYTSGRAWNHDLPLLLTFWALLAQVHGLHRDRPWGWLFLSGLLVGLAAGTRSSFLFLTVPFLLAAAIGGDIKHSGWRGLILRSLVWSAGFVMAMGPIVALFAQAPAAFVFGNLDYARLNTLYREAGGWASAMTLPGKLWLFLSQVLLTRPGNLLIALAYALWGFPRPVPDPLRAHAAWGQELRPFVLLLLPFLLLGALAPTPAWPQYFYQLFPFMWLAALDGLRYYRPQWVHERHFWNAAASVVLAIGLLWGITFRHNLRPAVLGRWFPVEYHQAGVDLAALLGPQSRILTLAPTLPLEGGLQIYLELATGPFAWRVAGLVTPEEQVRFRLPPVDHADAWLAEQPARAVLLDVDRNDSADEALVAEFASGHGYVPLQLRDKSALWMNPLATWDDNIRLAAQTREPAAGLMPGETFSLLNYLQAQRPTARNLSRIVRLRAADGTPAGTEVAQTSGWPWGQPTTKWEPGALWYDGAQVTVPADAAPGLYRVETELFDPDAGQAFPIELGTGRYAAGSAYGEYLAVGNWPGAPATPLQPETVIGGFATLQGYTLEQQNDSLGLRLNWQGEAPASGDYTVFTQLLDGSGAPLAQHDKPPLDGFYPTSAWAPDLAFADDFVLPLPTPLPPGPYTLLVGMYDPATGVRQPVTRAGSPAGDAVTIPITLD